MQYYQNGCDRACHVVHARGRLLAFSGISGEYPDCPAARALETFGAGSNAVEVDSRLSVLASGALAVG